MSDLSQFMDRDIKRIRAEASLREAAQRMYEARVSYLLVEDKGEVVGIVTEADLARRAMSQGKDPNQTKVRELMSRPIISVDASTPMHEANDLMKTRGFRHLVIMEKSKVVGMLTMLGLLRYFITRAQG